MPRGPFFTQNKFSGAGCLGDASSRVLGFEAVGKRQPCSRARHDGKGLTMKTIAFAACAALTLSAGAASAADIATKARPVAAPPPPAWDIAFGGAITSDYVFRGVSQSNRNAAVSSYFEPRYKINPNLELYAGIGGSSISFPNRAAAEIDFYGGLRPTFGKLALDIGFIYYYYPGGQCYNGIAFGVDCFVNSGGLGALPNGNVVKADLSFWEFYARGTYSVTDAFALGAAVFYSPSVLNSGAEGVYVSGIARYTFPAFANGVQVYTTAEVGHWNLGTSDTFYAVAAFPAGIPYKDYTTWNLGFGWTWKVFTVDLRYHDTDLNKGDCNAFTSDHTASGIANVTPINPSGAGSKWCGAAFVARLSADVSVNTHLK
jgi:uncharacterized protein (TIGR02001 family)